MTWKILTLLFLLPLALQAQKTSWRKQEKLGDERYKKSQYAEAADHYYAAWQLKTGNRELAYKAGECFYIIKNYEKAAQSFEPVSDRNKQYPGVGLKYARALKQNGQYEDASRQFINYVESYKGEDAAQVAKMIENEIRGCELGIQLGRKPVEPEVTLSILPKGVNSESSEFGPIPFTDDILYFSSTASGRAQIYRTQQTDGAWDKPSLPSSFPEIENDHFCNGTLTPDNKRFYFTICKSVQSWGVLTTKCDLYVLKRIGNAWSAPEKLRDYVNLDDATTTHPHVVFNGTTEIIYFSSNRKGGSGGMDIWFMTRDINSKDIEFTYPINAGPGINTPGDEITPYYDIEEAALYFSSNGHVSLGGFDIFKAVGSRSQWEEVQNISLPYNSQADDYFFTRTTSRNGGFLVSNRAFSDQKTTTTDEDIFSFSYIKSKEMAPPQANGTVYDKKTGAVVDMVKVEVYELTDVGDRILAASDVFPAGAFTFQLEADRDYELQVKKEGYENSQIPFNTRYLKAGGPIGLPVFLNPLPELVAPVQPDTGGDPVTPPPPAIKPQTLFKIQIAAVSKFEAGSPAYRLVEPYGQVGTEYLEDRKLYRVMVGDFNTIEEANQALPRIREAGFKNAYVVRYKDGQRMSSLK